MQNFRKYLTQIKNLCHCCPLMVTNLKPNLLHQIYYIVKRNHEIFQTKL